ncbi:MAG: ParB/Srx family N-terminal domain-containing protein [Thermoguttaceae bacterium]|jgi:hypothetical protein
MLRRKVAVGPVLVWLACFALARAADTPPFDPSLPAKSRCVVAIEALRPTQFAVGYREVEERAQNIVGKSPKKFKKYMEEHLPLLVVGPGGVPYLIDGHHLALALVRHRVTDHFEARIEANWRDLSPAEFWKNMRQHGWVYLYDNEGRGPLEPDRLPRKVTELSDDPYRALAWAVRKRGGYRKTNASFAEFKWAKYFRSRITIGSAPGDFDRAVEAALKISHLPEAQDLPGYYP